MSDRPARARTFREVAVAALAVISVAACATPESGPRRVVPDGIYHHIATGLEFPQRSGVFERLYVTEYDSQGLDVSGHYQSPLSLGIIATVYHYPATSDLSPPTRGQVYEHLRQIERDVEVVTRGAEHVGDSVETFAINGISIDCVHAEYRLPALGTAEGRFLSHVYLFVLGGWYLKFRISYPEDAPDEVHEHCRRFIESIRWPIPESPAA
jgi:hypothetical protein